MSLLSKSLRLLLLIAFAIAITGLVGQKAAMAAKGGGGKVSVTAADPSEADQGAELDVLISGSGFDAGSTAAFLVGGTTDASQVEVLSNEFQPDTGKLKSRIRVKGTAVVSEYDIQVTNSRGRRGKGTTLFRVKKVETACTGLEDPEPTIVYMSETESDGTLKTRDVYLSDASGCRQTLLVEDAYQVLEDTKANEGLDRFLEGVSDLRFSTRGDLGVVIWRDSYQETELRLVEGVIFRFDAAGDITLETPGPVPLYVSPTDNRLFEAEVVITPAGEILIAMIEWPAVDPEMIGRVVSIYNVDTGVYSVVSQGDCHLQTSEGRCFVPDMGALRWLPDGSELFLTLQDRLLELTEGRSERVIASSSMLDGDGLFWSDPSLLVVIGGDDTLMDLSSVSSSRLMSIRIEFTVYRKNGRRAGTSRTDRILDLDDQACGAPTPCLSTDGLTVPQANFINRNLIWTKAHTLIFRDTDQGGGRVLREILDPATESLSGLEITGIQNDFDTSN